MEQLAESQGLEVADIYPLVDYLSRQGLIQATTAGYLAAGHFNTVLADLAAGTDQPQAKVINLAGKSDQAQQWAESLSIKQKAIIQQLVEPLALKELMGQPGQSHRMHFKNKQLQPLVDEDLVALSHPDNPHHPDQTYCLASITLSGLGIDVKTLIS